MKKIIFTAAVVLSTSVAAQNLDPTVEVSREYEGKLIEVHKPALEMAVPDTLHKFDLGFDYSVFDNPYKGSYEFNPYVLEMRPAPSDRSRNAFYLNAGAGYTLHPTLDLLWSPLNDGAFSMDVFAQHRSYVGKYRSVAQQPEWSGYDLLTKAGADLGYDWKAAALDFGASYYGISDKDYRRQRSYNALDAYAGIKSRSAWSGTFFYDVDMKYRFAEECSGQKLTEHDFRLDATFGPSFGSGNRILFDLGAEIAAYEGALDSSVGRFYFVPRYCYDSGIWDLDLGLRISAVTSTGTSFAAKSQIVYPDVRVNVALVPDALRAYARVGGGEKIMTYASLIDRNHHLDLSYGIASPGALMNVVVERVSAVLGFEGRISSFFSYNFRGGYISYANAVMDAAVMTDDGKYAPAAGYSPCQKAFAALDWNLDLHNIRFDGTVGYNHFWDIKDGNLLAPSALEGNVSFIYDWNERIFAGVDCGFALSRSSAVGFKVPGFADLGIYGEYVMNRNLSFWLRGGNLLNMEIQRNLFFAEKGINFTAGICLSL